MTVFGQILVTYEVQKDVLAFIQNWLPTYIAELERQYNLTVRTIARPKDYQIGRNADNWPEDALPLVLLTCNQMADPEQDTDSVGYWFEFTGNIVVQSVDEDDSQRVASFIGAALMALIHQKRKLGGLAETTDVGDLTLLDMGDQARTRAIAAFGFRSFIPAVVKPWAGPTEPDPQPDPDLPYDDLPVVSEVAVEVSGIPINS